MEVYIGNLSPTTTLNDVVLFLKGFAKSAKIHMVDLKLEDHHRSYYAIADFDSDKIALKAISKLSGGLLHGEKVTLREFQRRNYSNERRALNWREKSWSGVERRQHERRLKIMPTEKPDEFGIILDEHKEEKKTDSDSVRVSAYSNMARKY